MSDSGIWGAVTAAAVTILLMMVLLPAIARSRETSSTSTCAANLHGIYQSMYTYATSSRDGFPTWGNVDPKEGGQAMAPRPCRI